MTKIFEVIRKPIITEKGQILREQGIQVFEVATWASKHQIKEAIELLLQAKVTSVRTVKVPSKTKALGDGWARLPRSRRPTSKWRKAQLPPTNNRRRLNPRADNIATIARTPKARGST